MTESKPTTTIRLRRYEGESTLNDYIFTDAAHAHQWLSQVWVERGKVHLDVVVVGPFMPCPRCGGDGHRRDVKLVRRLTAEEVLHV